MFEFFKKKNYLKRANFISLIDIKRIITKKMSIEEVKKLKVNIKLADEELEYIKLGHEPLEMEDHFFMYYDDNDNTINYYRSWTGTQVYKAYYNVDTKSIDRLVAHLVKEVYNNTITDEGLIENFKKLINNEIEGRKKYE